MANRVVIIGNGIAGITCARELRKISRDAITVISSETEHFYSRTALMYIFMGHLKYEHTKPYEDAFWQANRIELVKDHVVSIRTTDKKLQLEKGGFLSYDKLVIATGSVSIKPKYPGIKLKGVQSLYGMPDLALMNENTKGCTHAVVVGGGLIGIEMVEMLMSRGIGVSFLVREKAYWDTILPSEEAALVTRHIRAHGVNIQTATELKEIRGNSNGFVTSVITNKEEEINCGFVGIAVGVTPNISLLKNTGIETDKGALVNEYFETNIKDVYAIGDCAQHRRPPAGRKDVEQVWYTGRIHGEALAQTLAGNKTAYNPGPWFNSAKFFDIEYQTYGRVNAQQEEDENAFYWEHAGGKIGLRMVYKKGDEIIVGMQALGMRLRHPLCDQWLQEKRTIDYVMAHLHQLNFDPEFFVKHEKAILHSYHQQTGKAITTSRKKASHFFNW